MNKVIMKLNTHYDTYEISKTRKNRKNSDKNIDLKTCTEIKQNVDS